jgi:ubiquinone/menaquinone biosynthesis C-methylase UbiE
VRGPDDDKRASKAVWGAAPAGRTFGGGADVGSREFFERVMERRSTYEQPWLPEVVPFPTLRGKDVLEIGCGAGYDALTFLRNGAHYTGIDITPENPERVRSHLSHYGLDANVLEADAEMLPFEDEQFDVVYSNGVLHHTPNMSRALEESHRVLRQGGELYVSVYNRNSVFYLLTLALTDQILRGGVLKRSLKERLSMIEDTGSDELPLVNVYSARRLRALLRSAGFGAVTTVVRKLVPEDFPPIPVVARLWARLPQPWLDVVGRRAGWYVWAHGVKQA